MKTATTALVALVALGSFSMACSSSSKGESVDTGTALSSLRSPTGSFSKESGASAFAGYRSKRADSSKVSAPGVTPGGGSSSTSSIRLLDKASNACTQGQACACPNGGSMSYSAESSSEGQLVRVQFEKCGFEDGFGFDGDAILLASKKSLLGLAEEEAPAKTPKTGDTSETGASGGLKEAEPAPSAPAGNDYVALLLAAKGVATDGTRKLPLEFALLTEGRYAFLAVSVPDGNIVIGVRDDGYAIVRSKEGTWKCKSSSRGWACTSEKGEALELEDDGATAGSEPSPAPSPSSPTDPSEEG